MFYVYILRSRQHANQIYTGRTENLRNRLSEHNTGKSKHTCKFMPWDLIFYASFQERQLAIDFELYLKTGSGRAFARKHFLAST